MIVSHKHKFIFIHIPKTGGTTIASAMPGNIQFKYHAKARHIKDDFTMYNDYFSFAFVRNPWDRLYSIYTFNQRFVKRHVHTPIYETNGLNHYFECDFKTWLMEKSTWSAWDMQKQYLPEQLQTQYDYIVDENGNNIISHIARYENFTEEYIAICDKLNVKSKTLEVLNKSKRVQNFKDVYDEEMIVFVNKNHKIDIDKFNYTFE